MSNQHKPTAPSPETAPLFARKGEATPVGGRPTLRRMITMRRPDDARREPARLTGDLMATKRSAAAAKPRTGRPAARPAADPAPVLGVSEAMMTPPPANVGHAPAAAHSDVAPIRPVMGPTVLADLAEYRNARSDADRPAGDPQTIEHRYGPGPLRSAPACDDRPDPLVRTTLRLDDRLRQRLRRFASSETLSVQALVTRALERFLPTLSVRAPGLKTAAQPAVSRHSPPCASRVHRSVRFHRHLHWRLKMAASAHGRTMQSIMIEALSAYLDTLEGPGGALAMRDVGSPHEPLGDRAPTRRVIRGPQHLRLVSSSRADDRDGLA